MVIILRKIKYKIIGAYLILSISSFILIAFYLAQNLKHDAINERLSFIRREGDIILSKIEKYRNLNDKNIDKLIKEYAIKYEDTEVKILDESKFILLDGNESLFVRYKMNDEFIKKVKNEDIYYESKDYDLKVVFPIRNKDESVKGFLYINQYLDESKAKTDRILELIMYISIMNILMVIVLGKFLVRYITDPIERLNDGFDKISKGGFHEKIQIEGKDELSQLCKNFNIMNTKLNQIESQRREFVSNVCHELKTPLSGVKVLTGSLLYSERDVEPRVYREFLNDIDGEVNRLNRIIDDLKVLVDIDEDKLNLDIEITYINYIIEKAVERLKFKWEAKNIEILFYPIHKVQIKVDSIKIDRVITNIIDNAIKYSNENTTMKIYLYNEGKWAYIKIKDQGIGIGEEDQNRIFERFYRVDKARSRKTGGSGLGLSIAKQIVELHQGQLLLYSVENKGTEVVIKLPTDLI